MNKLTNHAKLPFQWGLKVLAVAALTMVALTVQPEAWADKTGEPHTHAKKPGNGGGGGDDGVILARARFISDVDGTDQAFVADGAALCGVWDYWYPKDTNAPLSCENDDAVDKSDLSKGGRWIFSTGNVCPNPDTGMPARYVRVPWFDLFEKQIPVLALLLEYPTESLTCLGVTPESDYQHLLIQIIADELFKKGRPRQDIRLSFWTYQGGRNYRLEYDEKLYVYYPEENNRDLVILTTEGAFYGPLYGEQTDTNQRTANLVMGNGQGTIVPGGENLDMPLTIEVERIPLP